MDNKGTLRQEVIDYIKQADERFLKMVHAMSLEYSEEDIVGYGVDGEPLTQDTVRERVKVASARVKKGKYLTQEEVEQRIGEE